MSLGHILNAFSITTYTNVEDFEQLLLSFFPQSTSSSGAADNVEPEPPKWTEAELKRRQEMASNELV